MSTPTYEQTLLGLAERDDRIVVMTAENRAAIRNLPAALGKRFIDVGIAEQTMVGAAAGLALRGRRPILHALATFLTMRAYEFIRTDVGIPGLPVKLVGGVPGFLSEANGPTHQALEDISILRTIPNMDVFCPADEDELVDAIPVLMARERPCYIRYFAGKAAPVAGHAPFQVGKAESFGEGGDVALLVHGFLLREALTAKETLENSGIRARVVNMRMLKPVDEEAIVHAARSSRLVVTIEDHFETGGLASIVAETLLRHGAFQKTLPLALKERWFRPGLLPDVLKVEGFDGESMATRVRCALGEET